MLFVRTFLGAYGRWHFVPSHLAELKGGRHHWERTFVYFLIFRRSFLVLQSYWRLVDAVGGTDTTPEAVDITRFQIYGHVIRINHEKSLCDVLSDRQKSCHSSSFKSPLLSLSALMWSIISHLCDRHSIICLLTRSRSLWSMVISGAKSRNERTISAVCKIILTLWICSTERTPEIIWQIGNGKHVRHFVGITTVPLNVIEKPWRSLLKVKIQLIPE